MENRIFLHTSSSHDCREHMEKKKMENISVLYVGRPASRGVNASLGKLISLPMASYSNYTFNKYKHSLKFKDT